MLALVVAIGDITRLNAPSETWHFRGVSGERRAFEGCIEKNNGLVFDTFEFSTDNSRGGANEKNCRQEIDGSKTEEQGCSKLTGAKNPDTGAVLPL